MLFLAFLVIPLIEIALFVTIGGRIGAWWTVGIVAATAVVGAQLVSSQGRGVWRRTRTVMASGQFPGVELAHGAMILVGGALLLTPGFLTDVIGLNLMIQPVREWARRSVVRRMRQRSGIIDV